MDNLTAIVIIVLSFSAIMNLQAFAQNVTITEPTTDEVVASYTALIVAIGTLVGTIGSIAGVIAVFIKNKQTREIVQTVGAGMVTYGQKTSEVLDTNRNLVKAVYELQPEEAKKFLKEHKADAAGITERIKASNDQLEVIKDSLPGDTTAKIRAIRKDLPKESFETKPTA